MARPKNPMYKTMALLEELKRHTDGITAASLSHRLGRNVCGQMSKLYAYGVVDRSRVECPRPKTWEYLYRTRLPRVPAPATVSTSTEPDETLIDAISSDYIEQNV